MQIEFVLVILVGIASAIPVSRFYRRGKAGSSEENAVFRPRYQYYLYKYAFMHPPQKQMLTLTRGNSDSSEEDGNGNSSEESYSMEEEGGTGGNQESAEAGGEGSKGNDGKDSQKLDGGKNSTSHGDLQKGKTEESDEEAENQNGAESKEGQENEEKDGEKVDDDAHDSNSTDSSITEGYNGTTAQSESTTPSAPGSTSAAYPFYSSTIDAQQGEGESSSNGNHQDENGGHESYSTTEDSNVDPYGNQGETENGIVFLEGDGNEKGRGITRGDNFVGYDDEYNYYSSNGYGGYPHEYYSEQ
ncbi:integrin-binding sialoprotein [Microcaecilia unicolor]|uniref:Integrin-binding sialoprotein n=1 Tax=Microcaecilia unicolor TaxID=1415580 RepID=A0A6P7X7F8_9AMPH|nr:bone sialoprotein 2 [Microcaecilia unicolor]XP_030048368.1 bone sialoprotein 2 [Microcaecilia unicolor]